jgi:thiol-disulfide isomerase/thioredoxin
MLCRCEEDTDLDIDGLEKLIEAAGLQSAFTFLWAQPSTRAQFSMDNTFGTSPSQPAFVIDNIPVGQHVEKYIFTGSVRRQRPGLGPHATPKQLFDFLTAFMSAPTPLPLILRTQPSPPESDSFDPSRDRSKVLEVVGSTFESHVLNSHSSVLMMLYSPSCPACHTALPVLDALASTLSWSSLDVVIAKMDRVHNDVPFVLRFASYPAIVFFRSGMKRMDTTVNDGELPSNRGRDGSRGWRRPIDYYEEYPRGSGDSCNAPLSSQDLEAFVRKHMEGGNLLAPPTNGDSTLST